MIQVNAAEQATNKLQKHLRHWQRKCVNDTYQRLEFMLEESDDDRLEILEELCRQGADLNHLQRDRGFALIPHVFWCEKLIRFFIDKGMDVNSRDENNGDTALILAIPNAIDVNPMLKYRYYCSKDHPLNLIKFLLDRSADPNIGNFHGKTAVLAIPRRGLYESYEYPSELAKLLLQERGADVEASDSEGQSVLNIHAGNTSDTFIKLYKGDVDVRNSIWLYSQTPLMVAASRDCLENCEMLLERGADINARDLQGYTALHNAVMSRAIKCAKFLIDKGADPKAKSVHGRVAYDLIRDHETIFTCGATPAEEIKIYEMAGAVRIIHNVGSLYETNLNGLAIKLWDKALDICKKFDSLEPSKDFLEIYENFKQNPNLHNEDIYLTAMDMVARLSETEMSKFWNLLRYTPRYVKKDNFDFFFYSLNELVEEFKRVEDFVSIEMDDFRSLLYLAEFFESWLKHLKELLELGSEVEMQSYGISHFHSIARLSIACFKNAIEETKSNVVSGLPMDLYVRLCYVLTLLHFHFHDVISENELKDTEQLLRTLVELDVRDTSYNSLMHLILCNNQHVEEYQLESSVVGAMIDFEFVDVKTRNHMGLEPSQWIHRHNWSQSKWTSYCKLSSKVLVKLADRGAHIDARNYWGGETIRQVLEKEDDDDKAYLLFHCDNLQCACARVLAKSLVPYVNRVPKNIVDFIRMHDSL